MYKIEPETKKEYNQRYYTKNHDKILQLHKKQTRCEICERDMCQYSYRLHVTSRAHQEKMKEKGIEPSKEELERMQKYRRMHNKAVIKYTRKRNKEQREAFNEKQNLLQVNNLIEKYESIENEIKELEDMISKVSEYIPKLREYLPSDSEKQQLKMVSDMINLLTKNNS